MNTRVWITNCFRCRYCMSSIEVTATSSLNAATPLIVTALAVTIVVTTTSSLNAATPLIVTTSANLVVTALKTTTSSLVVTTSALIVKTTVTKSYVTLIFGRGG